MNCYVLALCCLLIACPLAAAGELQLQVGPNFGAGQVDAVVAPGSGEHFFDLTFIETGTPYYEGLWAYDVLARAPTPGITLLRAEKPQDNWVLSDPAATLNTVEAAPDHLLFNGVNSDTLEDITTGKKAARIYYSVDPGTPPGLYNITLDPEYTGIASGLPIGALPPPVGVIDPGVVRVTPEPSAASLLVVAAAFALKRRRRG